MRVGIVAQSGSRHIHFLKAVVCLIPEVRSPCFVQCINASVFFHQKFAESDGITLRIELIFLTVKLIINLPSDDCRMFCIMRCRFFHNNSGQFLIFRRVVVVMSSSAMAVQNTVHVCIQNFRIFLSQPGRRCSRRGTKDHFHTHISSYIQKSVNHS